MKRNLVTALVMVVIILTIIMAFRRTDAIRILSLNTQSTLEYEDRNISSCGPAAVALNALDESGRMMVPLPGWGDHVWQVTTSNDSARFYFNQGLNLFYSFHMAESRSSFLEAQRHDSTCAMAYWGQAMASGPFINNTTYSFGDPAVITALEKGVALATTPLEKELILAQQKRYTTDKNATRKQLFLNYREAMKAVYEAHTNDAEIATLYADATMMINARDWYTLKGDAKPGTDEIIQLLEQIMAQSPDHPAALHYYIHMVEPSHTPERALTASDRLLYLLPSVTHMVHMPSHIYIRTGDYKKGVLSNTLAIEGYDQYLKIIPNKWEGNRNLYLYHNADMQGTNALMMGNYAAAKKSFEQNNERFSHKDTGSFADPGYGDYLQYLTAQSYLLNVRFGKWQDILAVKKPLTFHLSHRLYFQFGRGMALAKTGNSRQARQSLRLIKTLMRDPVFNNRMGNRSRTIDIVTIASIILEGTIAQAEKKNTTAIRLFTQAVQAEDTLHYAEPESWRIPARHFLGQAYIQSGNYTKAQQVFEEDLSDHPDNFWAVNGLQQVLLKQNKNAEVMDLQKRYAHVFELADAKLKGAVY